MQILTANSLNDGAVVYYQKDGTWAQQFNCAYTFSSVEDAERCLLEVVESKEVELVGVYLIAVEQGTEELHPLSMREKIRARGPSILSQSKTADDFQNAA
jgi:hypothetical protein